MFLRRNLSLLVGKVNLVGNLGGHENKNKLYTHTHVKKVYNIR